MSGFIQVAADVAALKTVVESISPEVSQTLKKEIATEHEKIKEHMEGLKLMHAAIIAQVSTITN